MTMKTQTTTQKTMTTQTKRATMRMTRGTVTTMKTMKPIAMKTTKKMTTEDRDKSGSVDPKTVTHPLGNLRQKNSEV
jgi:hypothetical protein